MGIENEAAYINLRKSIDSLKNVLLTDYGLFRTPNQREKFAAEVTEKIKLLIEENENENQDMWWSVAESRAEAYTNHAKALASKEVSRCPPGFVEIDGICVPI